MSLVNFRKEEQTPMTLPPLGPHMPKKKVSPRQSLSQSVKKDGLVACLIKKNMLDTKTDFQKKGARPNLPFYLHNLRNLEPWPCRAFLLPELCLGNFLKLPLSCWIAPAFVA